MRSQGEIWRQRLWVWVPALVFFLANATAYTIYQFGFADRQAALQESLTSQKEQLDPLVGRKQKLQALIARSQRNEADIRRLYAETFSTRRQRLISITEEVRSLARKAGLDPREFSYPQQDIQQYGLVKRSFVFSVEGNYAELRRFINLLELSSSYIALEEVNLSQGSSGRPVQGRGVPGGVPGVPGAGGRSAAAAEAEAPQGAELRINLTLSTLFARDPDSAGAPPVARRAAS